ncbi:MAG: hypothetical protein MK097_16270, partial [Dechloromonas sp.]|nr:hypothetical protein [Dechloromonas sp.]
LRFRHGGTASFLNLPHRIMTQVGHRHNGTNRPCVDAPSDTRGYSKDLIAQVQVLPCVRPVDAAIITAAGLYGDRGSGPYRNCALEALGRFPGFPDPVF